MQRATVATLTATTLATVLAAALVAGCADTQDEGDNPCHGQPIVYVESEDGGDEYHCGTTTGPVVPIVLIDVDVMHKAKSSPGKPVSFKPAPAPKVNTNKQPAPKAPAPKAPAAPRVKTGK